MMNDDPRFLPHDRNQLVDPRRLDYDTMFDLTGTTQLVIGAGRGFGETTSRLLKHLGANVVCVDADQDRGAAVAADLDSPLVVADATDPAGVERIIADAEAAYGPRIHGLVDIVGWGRSKDLDDYTLDDWHWDFQINLRHAFLLGKSIGPRMAAHGGGSMVFISSIFGSYASVTQPGYPPSKAALQVWIKQLAEMYGPAGVRANCVAPGPFLTPKVAEQHLGNDDALYEQLSAGPFLQRMGQPYEIASTAVFLLTRGAGYITGQTINVEGGAMSRNPLGFNSSHGAAWDRGMHSVADAACGAN